VRLARWVQPSELQATLVWAALVGCIGGLAAIAFRAAIQGALWVFTQHTGSLEETAAQLIWWRRLVTPAIGGVCAGAVLSFGAQHGRGHRSNDYMEAVALGEGKIDIRRSLSKSVSSVLTIGSGGSIGREGAMVQLSAMMASWLGQRGRLTTPRLRLLVACGAAAGLAAVYNVTFAAALFVADVVLGSFVMESLGPLLMAAMASSLVSRYMGGAEAYFSSSNFELVSPWELVPYVVLGFGLGMAAPFYVRLLRKTEGAFTRVIPWIPLRLAMGGLIVGALSVAFPEVWGNGRTMVNLALHSPWPWTILAGILVCKTAATAATVGSGAVGGVFTPTMFTGAMAGYLLGDAAAAIWPGQTAGPQAYALVGMGGFLAATTRAPLMAMLMLFEMTLDYGIVLPLMSVCMIAYYTARSLEGDSIYSESLRRKQPRASHAEVSALRVRDLMKPPPAGVLENTPFSEIAGVFASQPYRHVLVVTLQNQLRGVVSLRDVENYLQRREPSEWITAASLMRADMPWTTPETELNRALEKFKSYNGERLPVVTNERDRTLVGYISKTDVLLTLAHGLRGGPH
jgi:CIC family chloride channel protein